jgi:hypothetical protein
MFIQTRKHDFFIGHDLAPVHGLARVLRWDFGGKRTRYITLFGMCFGMTRMSKR